ncbi:MAG: hypothetical protein U5J83_14425 [Bryobacterales bacterium]|nr:hypothetical protein [Bryobacterales bacterium]
MDIANIKRIKAKVGRQVGSLIVECTAAESSIAGSTAAAQDVKKIVDRAFELVEPDCFGVAIDRIAARHGTTMPNKVAEAHLRTICELLDEARR